MKSKTENYIELTKYQKEKDNWLISSAGDIGARLIIKDISPHWVWPLERKSNLWRNNGDI